MDADEDEDPRCHPQSAYGKGRIDRVPQVAVLRDLCGDDFEPQKTQVCEYADLWHPEFHKPSLHDTLGEPFSSAFTRVHPRPIPEHPMIIPPRLHRRSRRAFTLAEMLVVIGIIAVLASITLVVLGKARRSADRSMIAFQMQTITVGLNAYQTDFSAFPITTTKATPATSDPDYEINRDGLRGARTLCKALMGACEAYNTTIPAHHDGKNGLGFGVVGRSGVPQYEPGTNEIRGKTYGPYLAADKFKVANSATLPITIDGTDYKVGDPLPDKPHADDPMPNDRYDDRAVLLDANGNPILYYPVMNPQAPVKLQFAHVSRGHSTVDVASAPEITPSQPTPADPSAYAGTPMYVSNDNSCWLAPALFRKFMGDANGDARITGTEVAPGRGQYVLWSAGPDGFYGPNTSAGATEKAKREFDDVTNFQGE
jgi:prepilin-type N-terminal cleavage/methylation domain-containing protein